MRTLDVRSLLLDLWDTVQHAGGKPSVRMVLDLARRVGAKFDDKAAKGILRSHRSQAAP
jgi:hypothetical protein